MHKIKIVRIIARLNIGGPAINASILSSCLDADKFHTKLLYGSLAEGEGSLEGQMRSNGVDMELVPELGREISPLDDIKAFIKIAKILMREKPDIVHTHTAKAGTLGRLAAICTGVKVKVHTFHGNVFRNYFGRMKTRIFILIERALGLFTTKIITVSPKQKDELVSEFRIMPAEKCEIIPLGVDTTRLSDGAQNTDLKKELGLEGSLVVGIVGRLVPIKNHRMFLESIALTRKARPGLKAAYLIVGDGELRSELEGMALGLGIKDAVTFLGWRTDLGNVYRAMDIVALTSNNEGTPLALIEAMSIGKAVIATAVGGVADIIEDGVNGILVEPGGSKRFSDAMITLLEDKGLRDRLAEAGVKKSGAFGKDKLVESVARLYTECLQNRERK